MTNRRKFNAWFRDKIIQDTNTFISELEQCNSTYLCNKGRLDNEGVQDFADYLYDFAYENGFNPYEDPNWTWDMFAEWLDEEVNE